MKIVLIIKYCAACIQAISAGFATLSEHWPTESPFDDESKKTK
jgi:hypothetical protein